MISHVIISRDIVTQHKVDNQSFSHSKEINFLFILMHPCIGTYKENLFIQHQCPDISPFCSIRSQQFVKSILSTGKKVPSTKRTAEISTLFYQ